MSVIGFAEQGLVPDMLIRFGIRRLLRQRLKSMPAVNESQSAELALRFAESLRESPLAVSTDEANRQHYEVPAEFYEQVLGPRLKYSCCLYENDGCTLAQAEDAMLAETCSRADLQDGQRILELGCGWGSLTLWIAEQFPESHVTAVSNSASQRQYIERRAAERGLANVTVITADMRGFEIDEQFDRIVSVEMFEHMRNYELLLRRVASWLRPGGKLFVHIFCHRAMPYLFETEGDSNWMGRHFFTGGMMPSENLLRQFDSNLKVEQQWRVNGLHYWQTCEDWLKNLDQNRSRILARFERDLGKSAAKISLQRWRIFFLACAELFRFGGGEEWFVGHYRFTHSNVDSKRSNADSTRQPVAAE